jgi:Na+/H+ antiporter NhaC
LGAAIVHLISNTMIALLIYLKSNEYFKININYRTLLPSFLICVILFFFSKYFSDLFNEYRIWKIFFKNGFTIITFFIFSFMFLPVMERMKINMILSQKIKKLIKKW